MFPLLLLLLALFSQGPAKMNTTRKRTPYLKKIIVSLAEMMPAKQERAKRKRQDV
jgi:hypothetical protein